MFPNTEISKRCPEVECDSKSILESNTSVHNASECEIFPNTEVACANLCKLMCLDSSVGSA